MLSKLRNLKCQTEFISNLRILGRPLSSMSSQGRRSKQKYHHFHTADSFDANNGSQLQVHI